MVPVKLFKVIFKDLRSVREKFFCGELIEVSNLILIDFILLILLYFNYWKLFIIVTILFQLYFLIEVKNKELSQIYLITKYVILYMSLDEIYFCLNSNLIYMILDNLTIFWLWYPATGGYSLVLKLVLFGASRTYRISGPS